jgi:hypothetical protein
MKITIRRLLGTSAAALALLLLAWFLWPSTDTTASARARKGPSPPPQVAPIEVASAEPPEPEVDILEKLGIDPKETPHCAKINQWWDRRVSQMTITQNMKDGQMMFNEKELACLTASPVPDGLLQVAEYHVLKPQPPGLSNGPRGREITNPTVQRVPGARGAGDGPAPR